MTQNFGNVLTDDGTCDTEMSWIRRNYAFQKLSKLRNKQTKKDLLVRTKNC